MFTKSIDTIFKYGVLILLAVLIVLHFENRNKGRYQTAYVQGSTCILDTETGSVYLYSQPKWVKLETLTAENIITIQELQKLEQKVNHLDPASGNPKAARASKPETMGNTEKNADDQINNIFGGQ